MVKIKLNTYYFDNYLKEFFQIVKVNKKSDYPYKVRYTNGFMGEKNNNVTLDYLTDLAKVKESYSKDQVKDLTQVVKAFHNLNHS